MKFFDFLKKFSYKKSSKLKNFLNKNYESDLEFFRLRIKHAIDVDDPGFLMRSLKEALDKIGAVGINEMKFESSLFESQKFNWRDSVVCEGSHRCIGASIEKGLINPNDDIIIYKETMTVKDVLWCKDGTEEEVGCWLADAKKNPQRWKNGIFINGLDDMSGLSLLMCIWLNAHEIKLGNFFIDSYKRDESDFEKIAKILIVGACEKDPILIKKRPGLSNVTCKKMIELGWCSHKDMYDFQRIMRSVELDPIKGVYTSYRPDIEREMEAEMLKINVSQNVVRNRSFIKSL